MTQEELSRFNRGNELYQEIQQLESKIQSLSLVREKFPRTERGWELYAIIDDNPIKVPLESEEFWKCVEVVLSSKRDQLFKLKKKFAEL